MRQKFTIAYKSLSAGVHTFDFEVTDALFRQMESPDIFGGKLVAHITLTKGVSVMNLHVEIRGTVNVACDRCLEIFPLEVDYQGDAAVKFTDTPQESDGDILWISPEDDLLDLTQHLYESICLSLPYQRVHPDTADGKSGCNPEMLAQFKIIDGDQFDQMYQNDDSEENDPDSQSDEESEEFPEGTEFTGLSEENRRKLEELKNKLK